MTVFNKNDKVNTESNDGIWLDYKDHHWLFFMKDKVWDKEEIQRINNSDVVLTFIQKGIVDAFLLEIWDCLETSDIPFCIKEAEGELLDSLNDNEDYYYEIIALDESNTVLTSREFIFQKDYSKVLKNKLKERLSQEYDGNAFDKGYEKLMKQFEPYELEQFTVFSQKK